MKGLSRVGTNDWAGELVLGSESQDPRTKEAGERRTGVGVGSDKLGPTDCFFGCPKGLR